MTTPDRVSFLTAVLAEARQEAARALRDAPASDNMPTSAHQDALLDLLSILDTPEGREG